MKKLLTTIPILISLFLTVNALEIRHYGEEPGTFTLYDDDGVSFNYEQGKYSLTELRVSRKGSSLTPGMNVTNEAFFYYTSDPAWVFMTE